MTAIIQALNGDAVDLFNPRPEWFSLRAVAHSLSDKNRFCGQARQKGYSVAQHCWMVSSLFTDRDVALRALLHELDEYLLPDIPGPLKRAPEMAWYRDICDRHMVAGCVHFGITWLWPTEVKAAIKCADEIVLATEARDLTVHAAFWLKEAAPLKQTIVAWSAYRAEEEFVARFGELTGKPTDISRRALAGELDLREAHRLIVVQAEGGGK